MLKVGDKVRCKLIAQDQVSIEEKYHAKSEINHPKLANIDAVFLFVTYKSPKTELFFIDSQLVRFYQLNIPVCIVLNKTDLLSKEEKESYKIYDNLCENIFYIQANNLETQEKKAVEDYMCNKIVACVGHSGVGKSTFINHFVKPDLQIQALSAKIQRGKQTTKQS